MQSAPIPANEAARLSALRQLDVLDSGPEQEFDALIKVASLVCGVPISLISLVDAQRQWFKANIGLPGVTETPRDIAFCAHAILDEGLFEVPDATKDKRFFDNPIVFSQPDIRFYAGAPIVLSGGERVGTLCVIDRKPQVLNDKQREVLRALAMAAAQALQGRQAMRALHQSTHALQDARQQAELASQSKGQFLANMSHEIRTPMNAILGLLNLLQATELTARQLDYVSKTEGAAKSLLGLLNDILDFSKVEAGKMTLEHEPFRLDRLLRNLSVVLSANVGCKPVEVLFDVDETLPAVMLGDALRLQQVLINLGSNAVKFTSQGQVVLGLRNLGARGGNVAIAFTVQDSGIGIAPEHQAHIFSGFSQAESSTTRRFGGTGLGLAICKRLVEMMGGCIAVASTPGVGSTFSFTLELPVAQEVSAELATPALPKLAPRRVLVVNDNPVAGKLMLRMVHSWGWPADLAGSGAQALEMVEAELASVGRLGKAAFPYPVVLMDWQMPGMDGWETTKRLRHISQQCPGVQPQVIMVTAHGRETLAQRSVQEQNMLNGFLVKPLTAPMLLQAVSEAAGGDTGMRAVARGRHRERQLVGMRILVVEDNLINQQVAEELLSAQGAIVSMAANGKLGVEAVAAAAPQFDVVLMDIQMPVMDGYTATRAIRDQLGLVQLPIIAMTANAMASDRDACIAGGMNEHVGKPFDVAQLVSLLIRVSGFQPLEDSTVYGRGALMSKSAELEVPGLELGVALARMSGLKALYARTAHDFAQALGTQVDELGMLLQSGEQKKAVMLLHTLKGNAGTLGALALAHLAQQLEALCKTETGAAQCVAQLGALRAVAASTRSALLQAVALLEPTCEHTSNHTSDPETPVNISAVDTPVAIAALRELAALLLDGDMAALQRYAELRSSLAGLPADFADAFDQALQDLEFTQAHGLCVGMLQQLQS